MYGKTKKGKSNKPAYAKGRKASSKKRSYKKKSRNVASITYLPSTIVGDRAITKLKYSDRFEVGITTGAPQEYVFRGNGAYDPYYGTGGSSCEGFSNWASFFSQYKVYASKINVRLITTGTTSATSTFVMSVTPATTATGYADLQDAIAGPYSKWQLVALASKLGNITNYMGTEKILGLNKKAVEIDNQLEAAINTNPAYAWYWFVNIEVADLAATTSCIMWVEMEYYIEFYDRIELAI